MPEQLNRALEYWRVWLALGAGMVLLVVYLSLTGLQLPQYPSTYGDKINHFIAYGALMGWFGQLFLQWPRRLSLAVLLAALGLAMEFVQGTLPHRHFGWWDASANLAGVIAAVLLLYMGADRLLISFEQRVLKRK